jgi:hypothetical protein
VVVVLLKTFASIRPSRSRPPVSGWRATKAKNWLFFRRRWRTAGGKLCGGPPMNDGVTLVTGRPLSCHAIWGNTIGPLRRSGRSARNRLRATRFGSSPSNRMQVFSRPSSNRTVNSRQHRLHHPNKQSHDLDGHRFTGCRRRHERSTTSHSYRLSSAETASFFDRQK